MPMQIRQFNRSFGSKARTSGFIALVHLLPLTLFYSGTRPSDWLLFVVFYFLTIFALGGFLHRYFAHHAFRTSRSFQFMMALFAGVFFADAVGFAGKHRLHHKFADTAEDVHSPVQGWWFCWIGSLVDEGYSDEQILMMAKDLTAYPELAWLHRYFYAPAIVVGLAICWIGGYATFVTAYGLNLLVAIHAPSAVNYFCHDGKGRNFATPDGSSNSIVLGYLFLGEGWHNNHHRYPASARLGLRRLEPDLIYHCLRVLAAAGLIWDLREPEVLIAGDQEF